MPPGLLKAAYDPKAIVDLVRSGEPIRSLGISPQRVYRAIWAHEGATGERLPRPKRPRPGRPHLYDHAAIIDAVRDGAALGSLGLPYNVVHGIVTRHEDETGERLPRSGRGRYRKVSGK